jgi:hypothetical protein
MAQKRKDENEILVLPPFRVEQYSIIVNGRVVFNSDRAQNEPDSSVRNENLVNKKGGE